MHTHQTEIYLTIKGGITGTSNGDQSGHESNGNRKAILPPKANLWINFQVLLLVQIFTPNASMWLFWPISTMLLFEWSPVAFRFPTFQVPFPSLMGPFQVRLIWLVSPSPSGFTALLVLWQGLSTRLSFRWDSKIHQTVKAFVKNHKVRSSSGDLFASENAR